MAYSDNKESNVNGELMTLGVAQISTKNRIRESKGDLTLLTASIKKNGLFHPIIVDKDNVIIAGLRRLEAAKNAGLTRVPVLKFPIRHNDLAALDIQSDENLCREPLTDAELEKQIQLKKMAISGPIARTMSKAGNFFKALFGHHLKDETQNEV